jgi:hypothetical protein
MSTFVPEGTVQEVLDWVGNDPASARAALDKERAGQNRATLTSKLEAIAASSPPEEPQVTEETMAPETEEAPAPQPPEEVAVTPGEGTLIGPVLARDENVEVPDDADLTPEPEAAAEEGPEPFEADQVEYFQAASSGDGLVLSFNGQSVVLNPQQVAQLKMVVDRAVVGLSL